MADNLLQTDGVTYHAADRSRERKPAAGRRRLVDLVPALPPIASVFAVAVGTMVLIGWAIDNESLKRVIPGFVAMNPLTAVLFIASGVALGLSVARERSEFGEQTAKLLAVVIWGIALIILADAALGWLPKVDEIFFRAKLSDVRDQLPNRMAPNTALNFVFIGLSLIMLGRAGKRFCPSQGFAILAAFGALLPITGYAYGVHDFSGMASFIPMALHTAFTFLILATGIFFASPDAVATRTFLSSDSTGVLARRLFPFAILVTLGLGWLRVCGESYQLYDTNFGTALYAIILSMLLVILIRWTIGTITKLEAARSTATARVHDLSRRKDEMLAVVSHDLCTPLTGCTMVIELLREEASKESNELLDTMEHSVRRMVSMVRGLLDIAKLEADNVELEREMVLASEVIRHSMDPLEINANAKQITLDLKVDPAEPVLRADRLRLSQIFNNLLTNAIKFTPQGGTVTVAVKPAPGGISVTVKDTGLGIAPHDLPHIFEKYFQASTKATAGEQGSGLGLAIVRELVHLHGGTIGVSSEFRRGSTFTVYLPSTAKSRNDEFQPEKALPSQFLKPRAADEWAVTSAGPLAGSDSSSEATSV